MIFCPKCHSQLVDGAKFCHNCGNNIEIPLGDCGNCGKKNPADAQFCYSCGNPMRAIVMPRIYDTRSKYNFQQLDVLEEQIKTIFFEELKRLASWIAPDKIEEYLRFISKISHPPLPAVRNNWQKNLRNCISNKCFHRC
jgi:predicted amidophosphoribosyltransferase